MTVHIGSIDPEYRIAEHALKFDEYALSLPAGIGHEMLAVPADAADVVDIGVPLGHKAVPARIGPCSGKGVGLQILFKRNTPIVGQIDLLPAAVVVISRGRTDGVGVFIEAETVEAVQILFKGE